jgi:flagellar L-ring protein precursor FlgH
MPSSAPLPLGLPARPLRKAAHRLPALVFPSRLRKGSGLGLASARLVIAAAALAASPAMGKRPKLSGFEPTVPATAPAPRPADGSIFSGSGYAPLYTGARARAVGDALTILLVETTTTSKSVASQSQKTGGISITPPKTGPLAYDADALNASTNSTFKGQGNASQTSSLGGSLSVTIAEVRPNGTALIRGEKRMLLSQGNEWIQVSGIVRLVDIDENNTLPSSRVADARITYSGRGALQRASKQGWLGQFFNMISPF